MSTIRFEHLEENRDNDRGCKQNVIKEHFSDNLDRQDKRCPPMFDLDREEAVRRRPKDESIQSPSVDTSFVTLLQGLREQEESSEEQRTKSLSSTGREDMI